MDCRELEERLEALLDGALGDAERQRCESHLESCGRCRELVEPFTGAETAPGDPAPDDLVGAVLARTSGPACGRAHAFLCGWLDDELGAADRSLVAGHLESCEDCRRLEAVLAALALDLPRLAELRPDARFVGDVMSATLPWPVLLRRWWSRRWPQWIRRPRFASEVAFIATMVLVLIVATPGSPLAAVPATARELARSDPAARLEAPMAELQDRFAARVEAPLRARWQQGRRLVSSSTREADAQRRALAEDLRRWAGTTWEAVASLLKSAEQEPSTSERPASDS